jgi:hypothetical protein
MTLWLAGMRMTADRLNDYSLDASTTTGLTAGTDFSVNSFSGRRSKGTVILDMYLNYTGAGITATTGNIADTLICTVPAGWRPPHQTINGAWDSGAECGGFVLGTDGLTNIRTASDTISTGANLRLQAIFNLD